MKRTGYISWDEYFMGICSFTAHRSKDPNTPLGCCIVSEDNRIISIGYNGMPNGCDDDHMPWEREGLPLETKYLYVCHAELNAILNSKADLRGTRLYTSLFPCNECAKAIIQSGIAEIVYDSDKYHDSDMMIASRKLFDLAGVKYRAYEHTGKKIEIEL